MLTDLDVDLCSPPIHDDDGGDDGLIADPNYSPRSSSSSSSSSSSVSSSPSSDDGGVSDANDDDSLDCLAAPDLDDEMFEEERESDTRTKERYDTKGCEEWGAESGGEFGEGDGSDIVTHTKCAASEKVRHDNCARDVVSAREDETLSVSAHEDETLSVSVRCGKTHASSGDDVKGIVDCTKEIDKRNGDVRSLRVLRARCGNFSHLPDMADLCEVHLYADPSMTSPRRWPEYLDSVRLTSLTVHGYVWYTDRTQYTDIRRSLFYIIDHAHLPVLRTLALPGSRWLAMPPRQRWL
jgi:hypothetical protein